MKTPAQRKAAERARLKDAGLVAVTVYVLPESRDLLRRYVKRLNQRVHRQQAATARARTRNNTHWSQGAMQ